jgi:hypothetical protein
VRLSCGRNTQLDRLAKAEFHDSLGRSVSLSLFDGGFHAPRGDSPRHPLHRDGMWHSP